MPSFRTTQSNDPRQPPLVSVGLPVYNGARFLEKAVQSLLSQTFADFELIIADNCSTDRTQSICKTIVKQDGRVRYIRHESNLGACGNWNFVAQHARGKYFKWASANDVCDPHFLELCIACMERDPRVVLAYGRTMLIDESGETLGLYPHDIAITDAEPAARFRKACLDMRLNNAQSGLIRLAALQTTRLERPYPDSDMVLMAELALLGKFVLLQEPLLYRRMGRESASRYLSRDELARFLLPTGGKVGRRSLWRKQADYLSAALRAPVTAGQRIKAVGLALRLAYWERGKLFRELLRETTS